MSNRGGHEKIFVFLRKAADLKRKARIFHKKDRHFSENLLK